MNHTTFDPLAWAATGNDNEKTANVSADGQKATTGQVYDADELAKARLVTEVLLGMGANIAESYDDYLRLGFALADGLGEQGRELYHQLCAQSTKYREHDCEKKWHECLNKRDGRTSIATFYKMAQEAGVDLSAIVRQTLPTLPHCQGSVLMANGSSSDRTNTNKHTENNHVTYNNQHVHHPSDDSLQSHGNVAKLAKSEELQPFDASCVQDPTFSSNLDTGDLPPIIREAAMTQETAEGRDKVILTCINMTSAFMPNVSGIYDKRRVYPSMYNFFVAPSGALKGELPACRALVDPVVWAIKNAYEEEHKAYLLAKARYDALSKQEKAGTTEPEEPPFRSPIISVNASATAFYQDLAANEGWGLVFETEADTLTQALKQDYGDYSSGLRKAFHHETIDYSRRKENEHVYIKEPRLSVMLTCTPGQIPLLLSPQNTENGLANRFVFYLLEKGRGWRNVFEDCEETLYEQMQPLGERFKELYSQLSSFDRHPLKYTLNEEQKRLFNDFFSPLYDEQIGLYGDDLDAFIFRLGLTTYRISMVLTVLRHESDLSTFGHNEEPLVCSQQDFSTALAIASCLINHTVFVYQRLLPHKEVILGTSGKAMSAKEQAFLNALPQEFGRKDYISIATSMGIPDRTADRYMGSFITDYSKVVRVRTGFYRKL